MWRWPFGSGGKRVTTRPPFFPAARSAATMLRMKSFGALRSSAGTGPLPGCDEGARQSIGDCFGSASAAERLSRGRRRERHRVVIEALVQDLAVLDLVDRDLGQLHRATVAQVD